MLNYKGENSHEKQQQPDNNNTEQDFKPKVNAGSEQYPVLIAIENVQPFIIESGCLQQKGQQINRRIFCGEFNSLKKRQLVIIKKESENNSTTIQNELQHEANVYKELNN